jgi:hypothetical protein
MVCDVVNYQEILYAKREEMPKWLRKLVSE